MLKISLDEGAVFDMLSVLEVKSKKTFNDKEKEKKVFSALKLMLFEVGEQIGTEKTDLILNSPEYKELVEANDETFCLVDLAKRNACKAKEVDDCNTKRYNIKVKLQQKWFGSEAFEQKM